MGSGMECFLDRSRTEPAIEIEHGTRFIIGTRCSRSSKWLLTNYGTRRFVINIKVSSGEPESFRSQFNRIPIPGNYRSCQCVAGS